MGEHNDHQDHSHHHHDHHHHHHHHQQQPRDYAAFMRERGYRVTPQRQLILDAIEESGGHTTIEEIYERVHSRAPAVNRATLYRTLDFLCEIRLISLADISGQRVYAIVGDEPHHHLVCRSCGKVSQLGHGALDALSEQIMREQRFTVDMEHLVIMGLCEECGAKDDRRQTTDDRRRTIA